MRRQFSSIFLTTKFINNQVHAQDEQGPARQKL